MQRRQTLAPQRLQKVEKSLDHETIFLSHYSWLLGWAQQLTRGSKEEAEDLVQELYVRLVQSQGILDTSDEDRLRGYLHRTLRNLSISRTERDRRNALSSLSIVEFDSAEFALASIDRSQLLLVRSDLAQICEYACTRRKSSRAASVLILRFFLGYYPSEIVRVLITSRDAVDKLTRIAQLEAKAFLSRPSTLKFMGQESRRRPSFSQYLPDEPAAMFLELRKRLFSEPEGECMSIDYMAARYDGTSEQPFTTHEVAHLASCRKCLEAANSMLNLPNLHQRFPTDTINPRDDDSSKSGTGSSKSPASAAKEKYRQTREHRPRTLLLAVDGDSRFSQEVNSSSSKFTISLDPLSHPEFVEVLSEQELVLLYLDLNDADITNPSPQHLEVALSDERTLKVEIKSSGQGLVIVVSYYDPLLERHRLSVLPEESESLSLTTPHSLRNQVNRESLPAILSRTWSSFVSKLMEHAVVRYGLAATVLGMTLGLLVLTRSKVPVADRLVPEELLRRSEVSEGVVVPATAAMHQTFAFEVRSDKGVVLDSGKIDALQSFEPRRSAMKLMRADGKLIAGRWVNRDGRIAVYSESHGVSRSTPAPEPSQEFSSAWLHIPEAADFKKLVSGNGQLQAQRAGETYDVSYVSSTDSATGKLVSADLVLGASTMRPVSETFRLRNGDETREYRFKELTYEVKSPSQVQESDFDPSPDLLSLRSGLRSPEPASGANAHLALEALLLLSNLGPEVERSVDLVRTPEGGISLDGVLSTADEKASVTRVFAPLRAGGQLTLALHSAEEPSAPRPSHVPVKLESLEAVPVNDQHILFDPELRAGLIAKGIPAGDVDAEIHRIANEVLTRAAQLHREAWNIRQVAANDFSRSELQSMQPEDKMLWLTLLGKHLQSYGQHLASLAESIQPLISAEIERPLPPQKPPVALNDVNELGEATEVLNSDSERLDRLLTAGLTLSPSMNSATPQVTDVVQLLASIQTRESLLKGTIERLQMFGQH
jgi:DNA-directed RNA polymerase specialized sigma24 family protein